jgi:hypothetical protein
MRVDASNVDDGLGRLPAMLENPGGAVGEARQHPCRMDVLGGRPDLPIAHQCHVKDERAARSPCGVWDAFDAHVPGAVISQCAHGCYLDKSADPSAAMPPHGGVASCPIPRLRKVNAGAVGRESSARQRLNVA